MESTQMTQDTKTKLEGVRREIDEIFQRLLWVENQIAEVQERASQLQRLPTRAHLPREFK